MVTESDIFVYETLSCFGEDLTQAEIERRGRELYDVVRPMFDVTTPGITVEYREPDVVDYIRPADRARIIRAKVRLADEDMMWGMDGETKVEDYCGSSDVEVSIILYPSKRPGGYIANTGSIGVSFYKPEGKKIFGLKGLLKTNGDIDTELESMPINGNDAEKASWLAQNVEASHNAFRVLGKAVKEGRLEPIETPVAS